MTDLTHRLAALGATGSDPDIDAAPDVDRGRRALRTRRIRRSLVGAALAVGLAGSATFAATRGGADHQVTAQTGVRLVAYHGDQLPGFVIARVPEGFVLSASTGGYLDIAPPDVHTPGSDFVGKVVVMLQSVDVTTAPQGTPVTVNGHPGAIETSDGTKSLDYTDGTHRIQIQSWRNVGWSDQQLIDFAEGVTVTADAQETHG